MYVGLLCTYVLDLVYCMCVTDGERRCMLYGLVSKWTLAPESKSVLFKASSQCWDRETLAALSLEVTLGLGGVGFGQCYRHHRRCPIYPRAVAKNTHVCTHQRLQKCVAFFSCHGASLSGPRVKCSGQHGSEHPGAHTACAVCVSAASNERSAKLKVLDTFTQCYRSLVLQPSSIFPSLSLKGRS